MKIIIIIMLLCSHLVYAQADQEKIDQFVTRFSTQQNIPQSDVENILKQANFKQSTIDLMNRPAEGMPWYKYRKIFLTPDRIDRGVKFWQEHDQVLTSISNDYGIPPEIILGILGVETYFGERKGDHRVLDALYTLAFGYPRRSTFFQSELEHFLLLSKEEKIDPMEITGSYAGAIGYCQFMPSSYRAYAKSYEEGKNRDLVNSPEDAMASIANYLKVHRWRKGESIVMRAQKEDQAAKPGKQSLKPKYDLVYFNDLGFKPAGKVVDNPLVALVSLEIEQGIEYWFGLQNFYVITRYNHSALYAMAVVELASKIKSAKFQGN